MYLKKLESVGFKSFAERINIAFVPGVTAVVGPNGSGKSNITDAIRWVLGEQSAKSIRGTKMEDIIFQGSDSRRALNVAEVTLTLDNKRGKLPLDYDEVSVTRRVYRSGESEFYINKQPCRLKDIIELFMDSGLGREAFSIISQGEVEEILSSKPEERRSIFEEAAGVLKYKQRKKTSEYKLAETQENLNRVEDIIHEINTQMGPLKKQAETAKKYLAFKEELTEKEIAYLLAEIEVLHGEWEGLQKSVQEDKEIEIEQITAIQKKEAWLEKEKRINQQLDGEIQDFQEKLLISTEMSEKMEAKMQIHSERSKHATENREKLISQRLEAEKEMKSIQTRLKEEQQELTVLREQRDGTRTKTKELEKQKNQSREQLFDEIENLKADFIERLNEQAAYRNELQSIERQNDQLRGKSEVQQKRFKETVANREAVYKEKNASDELLTTEQALYSKEEAIIRQLKESLDAKRKSFQEMQTKLYQGYQHIEKMKSRIEMLEEMKLDFQGFFFGVKAVLKAREEKQLDNIDGAIIELIDVPKAYITAVETLLGGQAQHVVVADEAAARSAINWLKRTSNGRATFLPLSVIKERFIPTSLLKQVENHPGYIGVAADLIATEQRYKRAVHHLMGHILVSKTLKDANEIAKLTGRKFRIVTLEGDVVNPGGAMSGGAAKKTNQSLFTRDKELVETKEKLQSFIVRADDFSEKVNAKNEEIAKLEEKIDAAEIHLSEKQQTLAEIRVENQKLTMRLSSLNDSLSIYDRDEKQANEEEVDLRDRKFNLEKNLQQIQITLNDIQERINALTKEQEEFKETQERLQEKYHEKKLLLTKQEERYESQHQRVKELTKQFHTVQNIFIDLDTELQSFVEIMQIDESPEELSKKLEEERINKESLMRFIQEKRQQRSIRTTKINDEELELKDSNRLYQQIKESIQTKEIQVNRLDVDLENRLQHLETEYTITYERAKRDYDKASDRKLAKMEVENLKRQIDELGAIHLGAIEEHERVYERFTFLTEQQSDLVEAKNTLYGVIDELDDEMKLRFKSSFLKIQKQFSIVFKELFGGGKAELILTDEDDLLETGIEIIAEPPGKKLKHLGLLSGGERALTAISLLFAILRVRPVPFCILDEAEAALDEANVSRFAKFIKVYSKETQFIVITHRKGTMEEADVLYGVTMQESGVSRLVSVKLEDTDDLVKL